MAGINERLRDTNAIYNDGTTVPANTSTTSSRLKTGAGGLLGGNIVLVRAATDIVITDTKIVTITLNDNDLATGGTDTVVATKSITASGETTIAAGDVVVEFIAPRTVKEYTSVTVATDDVAVVGTYDAFLSSPMGRTNV
jgi:hypothetical protein